MHADVFAWEPGERFDAALTGFFISHIPPDRFARFWERLATWLQPGGRLFLIEDAAAPGRPYSGDAVEDGPAFAHRRRLADGREYTIVKRFFTPEELAAHARRARLGRGHPLVRRAPRVRDDLAAVARLRNQNHLEVAGAADQFLERTLSVGERHRGEPAVDVERALLTSSIARAKSASPHAYEPVIVASLPSTAKKSTVPDPEPSPTSSIRPPDRTARSPIAHVAS